MKYYIKLNKKIRIYIIIVVHCKYLILYIKQTNYSNKIWRIYYNTFFIVYWNLEKKIINYVSHYNNNMTIKKIIKTRIGHWF